MESNLDVIKLKYTFLLLHIQHIAYDGKHKGDLNNIKFVLWEATVLVFCVCDYPFLKIKGNNVCRCNSHYIGKKNTREKLPEVTILLTESTQDRAKSQTCFQKLHSAVTTK